MELRCPVAVLLYLVHELVERHDARILAIRRKPSVGMVDQVLLQGSFGRGELGLGRFQLTGKECGAEILLMAL